MIPTYTPAHYSEIDWNPAPVDFETDKAKIKELFFNKVRAAASRIELERMWGGRKPIYDLDYNTAASHAVGKIPFPKDRFPYAVWGVVAQPAFYLDEAMKEQVPQAGLIAGIDIAVTGEYCGVDIIKPDEIQNLPGGGGR